MIYDPCEECDPMPPKQSATDTKSYRTEFISCSNCKFGKAKQKIKELKKYIRQQQLPDSESKDSTSKPTS